MQSIKEEEAPTNESKHTTEPVVGEEDRAAKKRKAKEETRQKHRQKRRQKKQDKKQTQTSHLENEGIVTAEMLNEATYNFTPGLRRVEPYEYTFKVFAKQRWQGFPLLDLFLKEFPHVSKSVYERKINRGDITINGVKVPPTTKIKQHDSITHKVHRHEPPVTSAPIKILKMDENIVVVDKPASIPVHPCGRYRHNSILFILAHENQLTNLYGVHRLDRLTSGLLLLARNSAVAGEYGTQISSGKVHKQYLARVRGEFPKEEVTVDQPIKVVNHKQGLNAVSVDGKACKTIFLRKSYDPISNTSIVNWEGLGSFYYYGRVAGIPVKYTQLFDFYIGYPITNDPLYNDDPAVNRLKAFTSDGYVGDGEDGEAFGEMGETTATEDTNNTPSTTNSKDSEHGASESSSKSDDANNGVVGNDSTPTTSSSTTETNSPNSVPEHFDITQECPDCKKPWRDPSEQELILYLHAYVYEGPLWKYETELPAWAL